MSSCPQQHCFLCLPPWRHCKTTLLRCGWGPWAGCDVSSSPWQYFGVDYLFSLAVCWFAESPLLIPPLLRLGSGSAVYNCSVPVALFYIKAGQDTLTKLRTISSVRSRVRPPSSVGPSPLPTCRSHTHCVSKDVKSGEVFCAVFIKDTCCS